MIPQPYNSYGNGAAMRISPVAYVGRTQKEIQDLSETVTGVSHNHAEGLKGAEATATAIFMAGRCASKDEIKNRIADEYYPLNFTLDWNQGLLQLYNGLPSDGSSSDSGLLGIHFVRGCHPQCCFAWRRQRYTGRHCRCDCGSLLRHPGTD